MCRGRPTSASPNTAGSPNIPTKAAVTQNLSSSPRWSACRSMTGSSRTSARHQVDASTPTVVLDAAYLTLELFPKKESNPRVGVAATIRLPHTEGRAAARLPPSLVGLVSLSFAPAKLPYPGSKQQAVLHRWSEPQIGSQTSDSSEQLVVGHVPRRPLKHGGKGAAGPPAPRQARYRGARRRRLSPGTAAPSRPVVPGAPDAAEGAKPPPAWVHNSTPR